MSTMKPPSSRKESLTRWVTPAVGLLIGCAYLVAGWASGRPGLGIQMFAIMVLFTVGLILAAQRSETVKGLLDRRDERITTIDLKATAFTGLVLVTAIILAVVVEIARGRYATPYVWLAALGGVSYLAAVIALRVRGSQNAPERRRCRRSGQTTSLSSSVATSTFTAASWSEPGGRRGRPLELPTGGQPPHPAALHRSR